MDIRKGLRGWYVDGPTGPLLGPYYESIDATAALALLKAGIGQPEAHWLVQRGSPDDIPIEQPIKE